MSERVLANAEVLVTGGCGFIGSHLTRRLRDLGATVSVIDLAARKTRDDLFLDAVDLRSWCEVSAYMASREFDYVFHLAAEPLVGEAYANPRTAFETNIMGSVNLLEALQRRCRTRLVIVASSDKVYGFTAANTAKETAPLNATHPYDVSKASADLIARSYFTTYGMPVTVTRFGNVYGEGDFHLSRIVPGMCCALINGQPLEIRSDGTYVRDYVYVADVVDGYVELLRHQDEVRGQVFNFSSNDTHSVLELIGLAEMAVGQRIPHVIRNSARNEIPYQHLDDRRARALGWVPRHGFVETFPRILAWYRETASREAALAC